MTAAPGLTWAHFGADGGDLLAAAAVHGIPHPPGYPLYLLLLRNSMPPELTPFNLPDATAVTGSRDRATLATQALYLLNNPFVVGLSQRFAARVKAAAPDTEARLRFAYRSAFGRAPTDDEWQQARDFLREAELMLASSDAAPAGTGRSDAWAAFCQALLSASELRYVD